MGDKVHDIIPILNHVRSNIPSIRRETRRLRVSPRRVYGQMVGYIFSHYSEDFFLIFF